MALFAYFICVTVVVSGKISPQSNDDCERLVRCLIRGGEKARKQNTVLNSTKDVRLQCRLLWALGGIRLNEHVRIIICNTGAPNRLMMVFFFFERGVFRLFHHAAHAEQSGEPCLLVNRRFR